MQMLLIAVVLLLVRTYLAGFAFDLSKFAPISMHIDDDGVMKDVGRQIAEKFDMLNPIGASDSQLLQVIMSWIYAGWKWWLNNILVYKRWPVCKTYRKSSGVAGPVRSGLFLRVYLPGGPFPV